MNFDPSDTQRMLLESAARVMAAHGTVEHWRRRRAFANGLDTGAWAQFAELGWLALMVSEEDGGLGGTMEDAAVLMTALGGGLAVEPYVSTAILAVHVIGHGAVGEAREAMLGAIAAGELRVTLAHAELGDRYEVGTTRRTRARVFNGGYTLNGAKTLALDAPSAGRLLVSATLGESGTLGLFVVDRDAAGLAMDGYSLVDGSHAADVTFDDVVVPEDGLIAEGAEAIALLEEGIDRATVALLAQAVGSMEASLDICTDYMKQRQQFGQPIGKFQALQHMAADMLVAVHQSRSILYQALAALGTAPSERARAVSAAKIVCGEAMQLVSRTGIQLHGGYGLTDEYAIGLHFRRLLVLEKSYGDLEYHTRRMGM